LKKLQATIENLYEVFADYTTIGIHHCTCGCINEENVRKLHSKPLRELETDDLVSYQGSALYTWGDIEHYKHFLPRILELISTRREYSFAYLDEVHSKLIYANWKEWPEQEQQAIIEFAREDWKELIKDPGITISDSDLVRYSLFCGVKYIFAEWTLTHPEQAIKNFVHFFYYHGNDLLNGKLTVDEEYETFMLAWLGQNGLASSLERAFYTYEKKDPEYAEMASVVLQIIEQELIARKIWQ
jgi:hypothetical protein